jgi:hypothetical protein
VTMTTLQLLKKGSTVTSEKNVIFSFFGVRSSWEVPCSLNNL